MLSVLIFTALMLSPALGSLLNATFSSQETPHCGKGTPAEGNAITFSLEAIPVDYALCLNVDDIFANKDITFFGTTIWSDDPSQAWLYNLTGAEHYNTSANYSQVFFQQSPWSEKDGGKNGQVGALNFKTFDEKDCGGNEWNEWSCNAKKGKCKVLPHSVSSFSVTQNQTEIGGDHCESGKPKPVKSAASTTSDAGCFVFFAMIISAIALTLKR